MHYDGRCGVFKFLPPCLVASGLHICIICIKDAYYASCVDSGKMQKQERQNALLEMIGSAKIETQAELVRRLRALGFAATQASISRDLAELGIDKFDGHYEIRRTRQTVGVYGNVAIMPAGGNLIVAKCDPGLASALAVHIDATGVEGIIGTIAGDDTVFIAIGGPKLQKRVITLLGGIINGEN